MRCDACIRLFRPINDTEVRCAKDDDEHFKHEAVLTDYAYPGSETLVSWIEADRRTFHGRWPGDCTNGLPGCILPDRHPGGCAS